MITGNRFCSGVLRLLSSFILLASLLVLPKVQAAVGNIFTLDGLEYTVLTEVPASQTGTVSVKAKSTEISGDIVIPSSVTNGGINYLVTLLPFEAFQDCKSLKNIIIPDSVASIGKMAFYKCSSLTSIIIPDSVTSIGDYAFAECSSLTSLTIGTGVTDVTSIGEGAFEGCNRLTEISRWGKSLPISVVWKECFSIKIKHY